MEIRSPVISKSRTNQRKKLWHNWFDCMEKLYQYSEYDQTHAEFTIDEIDGESLENSASLACADFLQKSQIEEEVVDKAPEKILIVETEDIYISLQAQLDHCNSNIEYIYLKRCEHQLLKNYKEFKFWTKVMTKEVFRLLNLNIDYQILKTYVQKIKHPNSSIIHQIFDMIENQLKINLKSLLVKRKQIKIQMGVSGYSTCATDVTSMIDDIDCNSEYNMVCEKIRMEWECLLDKVSLRCAVIYATYVCKSL